MEVKRAIIKLSYKFVVRLYTTTINYKQFFIADGWYATAFSTFFFFLVDVDWAAFQVVTPKKVKNVIQHCTIDRDASHKRA